MSRLELQLTPEQAPLFVAAGVIKTEAEIRRYAAVPELAALVLGSYSLDEWGGNDPGRSKRVFYWDQDGLAAYNAVGLQNPGLNEAAHYLPDAIKRVQAAGKLAIVGVTSLKHEDARSTVPVLVERALELGADGVEVNASCPNEGAASVLCMDHDKTMEAFDRTRSAVGFAPYIVAKMSALDQVSVERYRRERLAVDAIDAINSSLELSPADKTTGQPYIEVNQGYGGKSGPAINDLARQNLKYWLTDLKTGQNSKSYEVWSVGGIDTGYEVYHRLTSGARLVGGAQAFYRAERPEEVARRWAEQYKTCVANMAKRQTDQR